jgi:pSer/pThr/pTyr-binding forkhead associated (FHA) protein
MQGERLVLKSVENGATTELAGSISVGRREQCVLRLPQGKASRDHARISVEAGIVLVEDMGSTHGTFINGARLDPNKKTCLKIGDRIRFAIHDYDLIQESQDDDDTDARDVPPSQPSRASLPAGWDKADGTVIVAIDPARRQGAALATPTLDVPHLYVASGQMIGQMFRLATGNSWLIGSDPECVIRLTDQGVSGKHAKLIREEKRWKVHDMFSANHTFVNDKRTNMSYLNSGDRVRFGPVECKFDLGGKRAGGQKGGRAQSSRQILLRSTVVFVIVLVVALAAFMWWRR